MSPYRAPQCGTVSDRRGPVKSVWSFLEFEGIGGSSPLGERSGGDAQLAGPWLCAQPGSGVHLLLLTPELWGAPHMGSVLPPPHTLLWDLFTEESVGSASFCVW